MIINIMKELKESKLLKDLALKSYNSACNRMNNGLIKTFNKLWESKGRSFESDNYERVFETLFNKVWTEEINKIKGEFTIEEIIGTFKKIRHM